MAEYIYVVLDIGSRTIRAGFAGDAEPTAEAEANIGFTFENQTFPPYLDLDNHALTPENSTVLLRSTSETSNKVVKMYRDDVKHGQFLHHGVFEDDNLKHQLFALLKHIFSNELMVPPTRTKVLLINSRPALENHVICQLLLEWMKLRSVTILPEPLMAAVGANIENGLVISIGWSKITIDPVVDLRVVLELLYDDSRKFTGSQLHYLLAEELVGRNLCLFEEIESIIKRHPTSTETPEDSIDDEQRLLLLVVDKVFAELPPIVENIIRLAPIDIRRKLSENIVWCGGVTKVPGLTSRLENELQHLLVQSRLSLGSWAGASLYCANFLVHQPKADRKKNEITRDTVNSVYEQHLYR